jgi:hypothetical protein
MPPFKIAPISQKNFLKFGTAIDQFEKFTKKETEDSFSRNLKIMKKSDYFINPPVRKTISSGEEKLKQFENILYNGFDLPLNRFQREWAILCTQALLPIIMGEDWLKYGPNVLRKRKWKIPKKMVVAISTRRIGKTYFKMRVGSVMAKIRPGLRIAMAATAQRISSEAKATAKQLCNQIDLKSLKDNEENVWLENPDFPGDETKATKMGFYPSNPKIDFRDVNNEPYTYFSPCYHNISFYILVESLIDFIRLMSLFSFQITVI